MLESLVHEASCFVTLTYDDAHLPVDGSVNPDHTRDWIKRLRFAIYPQKVRYFLCGEYGDETWRPHYHACLFGLGPEIGLRPRPDEPSLIERTWSDGFCLVGDFNENSAQYVAGYVVKKMTAKDDWRLDGRHPEFVRMSRRPGLGASAMKTIAQALKDQRLNDAPNHLRMGRSRLSLGRYLRAVLRKEMGFTEADLEVLKQQWVDEKETEVLGLLESQKALGRSYLTPRDALVAANMGRIQSVEARSKLKRKGKL